MAITAANLTFTRINGTAIPSGSLHALFGSGRVGGGVEYVPVVVSNLHPSLTLSAVKVWLSSSVLGAPVALAYASAPIPVASAFPDIADTAPAYSSPTTKAAGIALANIGPQQKVLLYLRRTLSSATAADPQTVRIYIGGSSPL